MYVDSVEIRKIKYISFFASKSSFSQGISRIKVDPSLPNDLRHFSDISGARSEFDQFCARLCSRGRFFRRGRIAEASRRRRDVKRKSQVGFLSIIIYFQKLIFPLSEEGGLIVFDHRLDSRWITIMLLARAHRRRFSLSSFLRRVHRSTTP